MSPSKKVRNIIFIILVVLVIGGVGLFFYLKGGNPFTLSGPVSISQKVLENKFGWLGGGAEDDGKTISKNGGAWVRPHPGAFLWDAMQESAEAEIDFSQTDQEVKSYQKNNLGILVTLWPFADWDQENLTNAEDCKVSNNDEFLPDNDKKGRGSYLPLYRCNPNNWDLYGEWVRAVVERYDGDGVDDMKGLKMPIAYWEVMNEPDLTAPPDDEGRLDFYNQGPKEYAILLIKTAEAIKESDANAQVLIAGAAGGNSQFLDFYREVFGNEEAREAFDIGNVHCISNDQETHDFNVGVYQKMFEDFNLSQPIWVTEAEAMYGKTAEENHQSTARSTEGALMAGAERIFFTRYSFDDFRKDMSEKTEEGKYPSGEKYLELIESF